MRTEAEGVERTRNSVFFLWFFVVGLGSVLVLFWDCVWIQIPAGKNDSDFQVFPFDLAMKGGRCGDRAGRFDRASQMLRDQVHRVDYFLFSDEQDAIDALAQNREGARR